MSERVMREVDINLEATVEVECDYYPHSFAATSETPAELGGYVPKAIYWNGVDVTNSISEDDFARIERLVNRE